MNYFSSNTTAAWVVVALGILVLSAAWTVSTSAHASPLPKVSICHCESRECHTLHIAVRAAAAHLTQHDNDHAGLCIVPTPSVSPTPSPSPSPSPSPTPSPSPSPTPTDICSSFINDSQPIVVDDFNGYFDGSIVGQDGWQSYVNGDNFVIQGAVVNEGAKALYNNSFGDSVVGKQGTSRADGKQAVCFRTENKANWGFYSADGNAGIRVSKGLNASGAPGLSFASVSLKSDGNVAYYDQAADVYQNFATYNDNEWTLLEIEWRSSDKTARYRVNSGTWTDWKPFANSASFTGFDYANFGFVLPSGSGGVYFDTLK